MSAGFIPAYHAMDSVNGSPNGFQQQLVNPSNMDQQQVMSGQPRVVSNVVHTSPPSQVCSLCLLLVRIRHVIEWAWQMICS